MIKYTLSSLSAPLFSFSFKKYDEKGFLPYLYSSLIKIITISFKLKRVVYKSNYNSIYVLLHIFICKLFLQRYIELNFGFPLLFVRVRVFIGQSSCFPRFFVRFRAFIGQVSCFPRFFVRFRAFIGQSFPISRYSVRYPNSSLATPQNPPLSPAHYPRSHLPQSQSTYI